MIKKKVGSRRTASALGSAHWPPRPWPRKLLSRLRWAAWSPRRQGPVLLTACERPHEWCIKEKTLCWAA